MSDVSPAQGHEPFALQSVIPTPAPYSHHPALFSQFRGPFIYKETDEECQKREEQQRKQKEDAAGWHRLDVFVLPVSRSDKRCVRRHLPLCSDWTATLAASPPR